MGVGIDDGPRQRRRKQHPNAEPRRSTRALRVDHEKGGPQAAFLNRSGELAQAVRVSAWALLRWRRRAAAPTKPTPTSIDSTAAGSGTGAATLT